MKKNNKQISFSKLLCIFIGWLHCALIFAPLYTLVISFINNDIPRDEVIAGYFKGLLILIPVIISWFAKRYIRNVMLYILASLAAVVLTFIAYDTSAMIVPAVAICFLRFYNRVVGEKQTSLLDQPSYVGLALIAIPAVISIFEERLDSAFQTMTVIYMAVYFLLCFVHHGIERINEYIDVNKNMRNMPSKRIHRISTAVLAAFFLIFAVILLPALCTADIDIRYDAPERGPYATPEPDFPSTESGSMIDGFQDMFPDDTPTPIADAIFKALQYIVAIVFGIGSIIVIVYAAIQLSRRFRQTFTDKGDFVENLQEDDLETIKEKRQKSDAPGFFDRSPNAVVRRRYKKTIVKASKTRPFTWMTPSEAEQNAGLSNASISELHELYEKARYSREGCSKTDAAKL